MPRREFTRLVRAEIVLRATNAQGFVTCEGCGEVLKRGSKHYEIDHTIAEALFLDKSRKLTAKDGQLLGKCCHRGPDGKTAKDVAVIAEAKRREASHLGIRAAPKRKLQGPGFPRTRAPRAPKPTFAGRRVLYRTGQLSKPIGGFNNEDAE